MALLMLMFPVAADARGLFLQRPFPSYHEMPKWDINLGYRYEDFTRKTPQSTTTTSSHRFTEGFTMTTRGFSYHPALINYTLSLSPSWEQELRRARDGSRSSGNRVRLEYGIDGTLLALKPFATEFFAESTRETRASTFGITTELDTTRYGLSLTLPWWQESFPLRVRYRHQTTDRTTADAPTSTTNTDSWFIDGAQIKERSVTSLSAGYSLDQTSGGVRDGRSEVTNGQFQNTLFLTEDLQLRLVSRLRGRWTETQFGTRNDNLRLNEELLWNREHSANLTSDYAARYEYQRNNDQREQRFELNSGLRHQLYENLTTTLRGRAQREIGTTRDQDTYQGNFDMNYNRRIPTGNVNLYQRQEYRYDKRFVTGGSEILDLTGCDELSSNSCKLTLGENAQRINRDTLELRSFDGDTIFNLDSDYEIDFEGDRVFITLSADPLGQIFGDPPPEQLRVSYDYLLTDNYDATTRTQTYGGRLDFLHYWNIHGQTQRSKENFISGIPPDELEDDRSYIVGFGWARPFGSIILNTSGSYSDSRSATTASESYNATAGLVKRFAGGSIMTNSASYQQTDGYAQRLVEDEERHSDEDSKQYNLLAAFDIQLREDRLLRLQWEYEHLDSNEEFIEERSEDSVRLLSSIRLGRNTSAALSGRYTRADISRTSKAGIKTTDEERILIRGNVVRQLDQRSRLKLDGSYQSRSTIRLREETPDQKLETYIFSAGYEYRLGWITLAADYRYRNERRPHDGTSTINNSVLLSLKRALN